MDQSHEKIEIKQNQNVPQNIVSSNKDPKINKEQGQPTILQVNSTILKTEETHLQNSQTKDI